MMKDSFLYMVSAAGRVNLIGEHIDYCGGKVMPAALSLKNSVYIRPNKSDKIHIRWRNLEEEVLLSIDRLSDYKKLKYANYIAGSLYEWGKEGNPIVGADMYFDCSIPFGSGLSSSAAIEVSTISAMCVITDTRIDKPRIALAAQRAEKNYVGVNCGIMDQFASACGIKGHAMLLDCASLQCDQVPLELGMYSFVIANSNKPHVLGESEYNTRRSETEQALSSFRSVFPIKSLAELGIDRFESLGKKLLNGKIFDRAKHVVYECNRVLEASAAIKVGELSTFGALLNESHESLKTLYEVTGKELDILQESALSSPYCIGSRMTGAGFGGCTVSLVETKHREDFSETVKELYTKKIGYAPTLYYADISDGIMIERL